jgi:hypothetical protein
MKYIVLFFVLLSLALCEAPPRSKLIAVEDAFVNVKKNILECISKSETASAELKKYATDLLATDLKESLNLHKYRENLTDKEVIRNCRREAFIHDTVRKPMRPNISTKRFLAK